MFNILIVDDNKNNIFSISALLKELEVGIYEASNGEEALSQLMEKNINLIILDVQLPDYNGFQLAKMIKGRKSTHEIPIILNTAVFKAQVFVEQGFEAGAIDYILKPINGKVLISKVKYYIKIHSNWLKLYHERNIFKMLLEECSKEYKKIIRIYGSEIEYSNEEFLDDIAKNDIDEEIVNKIVLESFNENKSIFENRGRVKYETSTYESNGFKKVILKVDL